jgi:hypothetical protein
MSWKISRKIADILNKGSDNAGIDREEALSYILVGNSMTRFGISRLPITI